MVEKAKEGAQRLAQEKGSASGESRSAGGMPDKRGRITVSARADRTERLEKRTALMLATRARRKAAGLLFDGPHDKALLLVSCNDVHTVGMRHAIDVAFVDRAGLVVEAHRAVGPLRRLRNDKAVAVVERFASCDAPWFAVGDQVMISGGKETVR
ncbi:DUF192 domain-containing protein [Gordonibacter sp. 28C]|uniref:DUF192 domain-containing protein n=1 Tax=Gordonibacter sp. 28C TaxID=2078569 RepID=UPI001F541988|nr:DUF192 domain-containing protein [Gordonibacter sp. 28C]